MSKDEKKEVQKNYSDYSYIGDETISMPVQDFMVMRKGLEKALNNGIEVDYPQIVRWFNLEEGKPVENPSEKDIQDGKVRQFADNEATFSEANQSVRYNNNIYPEIYNALQTGMKVHTEMVDAGVAKPLSEVKKAYEERKAKGQMRVEDEAGDTPSQSPMGVVRDEPESKE